MTDYASDEHYRQLGEQLRPMLEQPARDMPIARVLEIADAYRREQRWSDAALLYEIADRAIAPSAAVKHNLALCRLGMGDSLAALVYAGAALELAPYLWQSEVVRIKALKSLKRIDEALDAVRSLLQREPCNGDARLELADLLLHELGDARGAQAQVEQLLDHERHAEDAVLTGLMARLYDRDESGEQLTAEIIDFARAHLAMEKPSKKRSGTPRSAAAAPAKGAASRRRSGPARLRIGLISPLFCCSPVYFFCIGALKLLANDFDLVFIHRGTRRDWATAEFRAIAKDWFDLPTHGAEALAAFLHAQAFDVLFDLGGWMDTQALRALSTKPAKRMYKWVGGQSATTGLAAFDGMLTDRYQTPRPHQGLYTEPLVLLKQGYVTYCAPDYMPAPVAPDGDAFAIGVIANPAKVSRAFLDALVYKFSGTQWARLRKPLTLRFIDQRYRHAGARARIEARLSGLEGREARQVSRKPPRAGHAKLEFLTPADHPAYLAEVGKLHAVLDTHPYSGGLTTVEALALGVPCLTRAGALFSERHSYAHFRYAGMDLEHTDFDKSDLFALCQSAGNPRQSLISGRARRVDHDGLARELAALLTGA